MKFINWFFDVLENLTAITLYGKDELVNNDTHKYVVVIIFLAYWIIASGCQFINCYYWVGKEGREAGKTVMFWKDYKNKKIARQHFWVNLSLSLMLPFIYEIMCLQVDVIVACILLIILTVGMISTTAESGHGMFGLMRSINNYFAKVARRQDKYDGYLHDYNLAKTRYNNINL